VLGGELGMNCGAELAGDLAHGGGVARVVMRLGWWAMTRPYNARPWLQRAGRLMSSVGSATRTAV
jgi:hypothetical protein